MVSDTGGTLIQPVPLCMLLSTETLWEVSVGPDGQWYWWGLDTACDSVCTLVSTETVWVVSVGPDGQ